MILHNSDNMTSLTMITESANQTYYSVTPPLFLLLSNSSVDSFPTRLVMRVSYLLKGVYEGPASQAYVDSGISFRIILMTCPRFLLFQTGKGLAGCVSFCFGSVFHAGLFCLNMALLRATLLLYLPMAVGSFWFWTKSSEARQALKQLLHR